jgi:hypothetical protein
MLKIALVPALICILTAASALAGSDVDAWLRRNQEMEEEKRRTKDTLETIRRQERLDADNKQMEEEHAVQRCPSLGMNIELNERCPPSR